MNMNNNVAAGARSMDVDVSRSRSQSNFILNNSKIIFNKAISTGNRHACTIESRFIL